MAATHNLSSSSGAPPIMNPSNSDIRGVRHPAAVCCESWEFRKICPEGSVFPNAFIIADIDEDHSDEFVIGTTEGQLLVMVHDQRSPLFATTIAATISVILFSMRRKQVVVVSLEGQCELREAPTPAQLGKVGPHVVVTPPAHQQMSSSSSPSAAAPAPALSVATRFTIPANCTCGDMDDTGTFLFLGSSDRRVYVYDLVTRSCVGSLFLQSQVFSVRSASLLPNLPLLLIGSTTDLVVVDADPAALAMWESKKIDVEHEHTGTDEESVMPSLRPPWVFRFQRDASDVLPSSSSSMQRGEFGGFGLLPEKSTIRVLRGGQGSQQLSPLPAPPSPLPSQLIRSGGSSGRSIRLPVALDWLPLGNGRANIVALTEDGYVWLFRVWVSGRCLDDPDAQVIRLVSSESNGGNRGGEKPKLLLLNLWRGISSIRYFRSMIQRVSLLSVAQDRILIVALATDGTCFILDSSRHLCITQLRADVCTFSVLQKGSQVMLVCLSVDEIVEYLVTPAFSTDLEHSPPVTTATLSGGAAVHCSNWDDDERKTLLDVGRQLFPHLGNCDETEILRRVEWFCAHGMLERDWNALQTSVDGSGGD